MRRIMKLGLFFALLIGMVGFAIPASANAASTTISGATTASVSTGPAMIASSTQHDTVLVGSENPARGVSIMSFFPQDITIHVGDTVTWKANSHEIHTVTFLAGNPMPDIIIPAPAEMASPLQINPLAAFPTPTDGQYDGTTYLNSGIISTDPGSVQTFNLTFTQEGVYEYVCIVHGQLMSGKVMVVGDNEVVPTPAQVHVQALMELKAAWANVPAVLAQANAQAVPPVRNSDGTYTHTIKLGYMSGNIMIMGFFPKMEMVRPGDTVIWELSSANDAPHTVTFYNGAPDESLVVIAQGSNGLVALVNPVVLLPSDAVEQGTPLNKTDFFNSGILMPGGQTSFSLTVGSIAGLINYECILHDTSGMTGSLIVAPQNNK
jgi:plastocyanin